VRPIIDKYRLGHNNVSNITIATRSAGGRFSNRLEERSSGLLESTYTIRGETWTALNRALVSPKELARQFHNIP
jgi:hypothetical protein